MNRIYLPFQPDMLEAVLKGKKTCTSRRKQYGVSGDFFITDGRKFVLTAVSHVRLLTVALYYFHEEGFKTPNDFIEKWKTIHYKVGYQPDQLVWLHEFEEVK